MPTIQDIQILVADDDEIDKEVVIRALKKRDIQIPVTTASDGLEALEILQNNANQKNPKTFITLLDLNMPRMSGLEFLEKVRADPKLAHSVIFVLSTSNDSLDIKAAYSKNVAGYITKSTIGNDITKLTNLIEKYATSVQLPRP